MVRCSTIIIAIIAIMSHQVSSPPPPSPSLPPSSASCSSTPHTLSCPIGRSNSASDARVRMCLTFRDPSHTLVPHKEVQLSLRCQGSHASPCFTFRDRSHTFVPHREVQLSFRCQGSHASPCFVFRDPSHRGPTKPHVLEHPSPFLPMSA